MPETTSPRPNHYLLSEMKTALSGRDAGKESYCFSTAINASTTSSTRVFIACIADQPLSIGHRPVVGA